MDGSESSKAANVIGYSNSRFIADAGDDKAFVELRAEKGKDVGIANGGTLTHCINWSIVRGYGLEGNIGEKEV